jgi:hypothetical protein
MPVTGSLVIADTGQADTQDGSAQCMHEVFMKEKPLVSASFVSIVPWRYILIRLKVWPAGVERCIPQLVHGRNRPGFR